MGLFVAMVKVKLGGKADTIEGSFLPVFSGTVQCQGVYSGIDDPPLLSAARSAEPTPTHLAKCYSSHHGEFFIRLFK